MDKRKPDGEYLKYLIETTRKRFDEFEYPVLGKSLGYYLSDSLEYVQEEYYAWYQDRQ